jgi:hypothetical protein
MCLCCGSRWAFADGAHEITLHDAVGERTDHPGTLDQQGGGRNSNVTHAQQVLPSIEFAVVGICTMGPAPGIMPAARRVGEPKLDT